MVRQTFDDAANSDLDVEVAPADGRVKPGRQRRQFFSPVCEAGLGRSLLALVLGSAGVEEVAGVLNGDIVAGARAVDAVAGGEGLLGDAHCCCGGRRGRRRVSGRGLRGVVARGCRMRR